MKKIIFLMAIFFMIPCGQGSYHKPSSWAYNKPPFGTPINYQHPLSYLMVACWLFNENGDVVVSSAVIHNAVNASFGPAACPLTCTAGNGKMAWTKGKFGGSALQLTAAPAGARLVQIQTAFQSSSGWTIAAWVRKDGTGGAYHLIFDNTSTSIGLFLHNGKMDFFDVADHDGVTVLSLGKWYHLVITGSGNPLTTSYYINGQLDATFSGQAAVNLNIFTTLISDTGPNYFLGTMDNMMVWTRVLTLTQIRQLYTDPFCMFQSPTTELRQTPGGLERPLIGVGK